MNKKYKVTIFCTADYRDRIWSILEFISENPDHYDCLNGFEIESVVIDEVEDND